MCAAGLCVQTECVRVCYTACRWWSAPPPAGSWTGMKWRPTTTCSTLSATHSGCVHVFTVFNFRLDILQVLKFSDNSAGCWGLNLPIYLCFALCKPDSFLSTKINRTVWWCATVLTCSGHLPHVTAQLFPHWEKKMKLFLFSASSQIPSSLFFSWRWQRRPVLLLLLLLWGLLVVGKQPVLFPVCSLYFFYCSLLQPYVTLPAANFWWNWAL